MTPTCHDSGEDGAPVRNPEHDELSGSQPSRHVQSQAEGARLRRVDTNDTAHRRLVYAAVVELTANSQVAGEALDLLAVRDLKSRVGALIVKLGDDDDDLAARLKKLLVAWKVSKTSIIVLGSEARGRALMKSAKPLMTGGRLFVSGVTEDGERWGVTDEGPLAGKIAAVLAPDATLDWAEFEARIRKSTERANEQNAFAAKIASRRPIVTYGLIAANLAMFVLELVLGGFDPNVRLLIRLGGIVPDLVFEGEVWRLVSGAFLHGSLMHLGFNMLVLGILGRFAERIIGPARFLVLYTACALAGSIASTFFMNASVSVGASGALWGILAAHAVFAFAPGFLPVAVVAPARRSAMINLGLNVAASFQPHVDWAAHAGGGLLGAALLYLVLARGVPRGEALGADDPTTLPGLSIAAGLCALVLAAGAIAGPILGGAFVTHPSTPTYERVVLEGAEVSFEIPIGLSAADPIRTDAGGIEQAFGDVMRDPTPVVIRVTTIGTIADEEMPSEIAALMELLREPPEHASVSDAPRERDAGAFLAAVSVSYLYESELRHDVFIVLYGMTLVRVEAFYWPDEATHGTGVARHVAESLQPL